MKFRILLTLIPLLFFLFGTNPDCPKIGLVLSGGGARGFAHIGTLKMLDSLDIKVDYIVGTSIGALVGALYAIGKTGKEIEKMAFVLDWNEVLTDTPKRQDLPHFQKKDTGKYQVEFGIDGVKPVAPIGYIHGQKVLLELSRIFGKYEQIHSFDDLPIPYRCVASDIVTGTEVVFNNGSLTEAVRASLTIPTIFSPVSYGDSLLVDGGLLNNLPVDIAIEMGANIILAVDAGTPKKTRKQLKNALDILEQVISIQEYEREAENAKLADYLIRPNLDRYRSVNFSRDKLLSINKRGHQSASENIELFNELKQVSYCNKKTELITKNETNGFNSKKISSIEIIGNKKFKDGFLKQNLGINIGDEFHAGDLQNRIMQLYSLGYFTTIYYTIKPEFQDKIGLVIKVQENLSNKMRLGIRWDKKLELLAVVDFQLTDLLITGLRLEHQFQFVGLRKNTFNLFYPSRTLDFPIYPFFRGYDLKIPFDQYNYNGTINGLYTYHSQMAGTGIGLQLKNKWFIEVEYDGEIVNVTSEFQSSAPEILKKDITINKIFISSKLDLIDEILLPRYGNLISINYEYSSSLNYSWFELISDWYYTIGDHTFRLKNQYSDFNNLSLPYLFHYSHNRNRTFSFSGDQLFGVNLLLNQFEYRYEYKMDIFFKFLFNDIITRDLNNSERYNHSIGYGIGATLISPLGPMDLIWSWSDKSIYNSDGSKYDFKFTAGYKF